jgi:translocation and assembly module TamB
MTRSKRWLTIGVTVIAMAGVLFAAIAYTMQSAWFQERLWQYVVASLEQSTGARVEIKSIAFDWRNATAEFESLIMHGSELPGDAPLFTANRVRVQFKLSSLIRRRLSLESIQVRRPEVHLLIRPDGSTNMPQPNRAGGSALETLMDLRVDRFSAENGALLVNLRRMPLQLSGQEAEARWSYDAKSAAYEVQFSSKATRVEYHGTKPLAMNVAGRVRIAGNGLTVHTLRIASGSSMLHARGGVRNFASPSADFQISTKVDATDAARMLPFRIWRGGAMTLAGVAHYDSVSGARFRGTIAGRDLSYGYGVAAVSGIDLYSDIAGSDERVEFSRVVVNALGAKVTGQAELAHFENLELKGKIVQLDISRAASKLLKRSLAWNSFASGRFRFSGSLAGRTPEGTVTADLNLTPAPGQAPVSGHVVLAYRTPGRSLEFGNSRLDFPGTHLSFSGMPGATMQVAMDSVNLEELHSAILSIRPSATATLPVIEKNGKAHFDGSVIGLVTDAQIAGNVALSNFVFKGHRWDQLQSQLSLSQSAARFDTLTLASGSMRVTGKGHLQLTNWVPMKTSEVRLNARFQGVDITRVASELSAKDPLPVTGTASGSVDLSGRVSDPIGKAQLRIKSLDSSGLHANEIQIDAVLDPDQARLTRGRMQSGSAIVSFSGTYSHAGGSWRNGRLAVKIDSNGFPLASIAEWRKQPAVDANAEIHAQGVAQIVSGHIEPATADGILTLRDLTVGRVPLGVLKLNAITINNALKANLTGDLRGHSLIGAARVRLGPDSPMDGEVHFDHVDIAVLNPVLFSGLNSALPFGGAATGRLTFSGPLLKPARWRSTLEISGLEVTSKLRETTSRRNASELTWRNVEPVVVTSADGTATIQSFHVSGKDTALSASGSIRYDGKQPASIREGASGNLDLRVNGSVDLQLLQLLDANLHCSGHANVSASIRGTARSPSLNGTLDIAQGTLLLASFPNGLSNVNGRIAFNRDRATIQKLTAEAGGGNLTLGGFVSFASAGPLVYHLQANADNVRLRYMGGVSVTANADLRLTGSSQSSILSGTATLSRVVFNPNTDVGNLLAAFGAPALAPASTNDFVAGLHLDIAIESAPNLQLSTALSRDVEAEIDLRVRGTPDHPVLLGSISANQGEIKVFGTKYSINRGEVSFQNAVRIEPVLDLDLQTQTRGITVNITISGTVNRLNMVYRSDPPMQPRDIIALLTVGRAPETSTNVSRVQNPSDVSTLQSNASTVLGQAISPAPNRLSKLFGITNVKIDPMVQGIVTNTPQARLTLEQQVSRDLTVTYVTNLSQTSEQIFRVEWALNPQYSLVAVRDENGEFGIDIQYKKRF